MERNKERCKCFSGSGCGNYNGAGISGIYVVNCRVLGELMQGDVGNCKLFVSKTVESPKNFMKIMPNFCCANCDSLKECSGSVYCERPQGPVWQESQESSDSPRLHKCNFWKRKSRN